MQKVGPEIIKEKRGHVPVRCRLLDDPYFQIPQVFGETGNPAAVSVFPPVRHPVHTADLVTSIVEYRLRESPHRRRRRVYEAQNLPVLEVAVPVDFDTSSGVAAERVRRDIRRTDFRP